MSAVRYFVPIFPLLMLAVALLRFFTGRQSEETMNVFLIMVAVCVIALLISLWWAFGPRIWRAYSGVPAVPTATPN